MKAFLQETILRAGAVLMESFGHAKVLGSKESVVSILTEADLASDKLIVEAIKSRYPEHGIVSEESGNDQEGAEYVWHVDPLDGTKNFASRVPLFGINMALARHGEVVLAAIYLPATGELVVAERGKGTFLTVDGRTTKLSCSSTSTWEGAYGIGPVRFTPETVRLQENIFALSGGTAWISAVACASVSGVWVADGRRDWYTSSGKNSWDFAAPWLIAKEAGCHIVNFAGEPWSPGDRGIIISNAHLHADLLAAVRKSYDVVSTSP